MWSPWTFDVVPYENRSHLCSQEKLFLDSSETQQPWTYSRYINALYKTVSVHDLLLFWSRVREIRRTHRTCLANFEKCPTKDSDLAGQNDWGELIKDNLRWIDHKSLDIFIQWNVQREFKMSGEGLKVRRTKCPPKLRSFPEIQQVINWHDFQLTNFLN